MVFYHKGYCGELGLLKIKSFQGNDDRIRK